MNWPKSLTKRIKNKVNLAGYTTFKIGGEAEFFMIPRGIAELKTALVFAKEKKLPVHILGSGSNILVSDDGVKGLVIKIDGKYFKGLYNKGNFITAGSGLKLSQLVLYAKEKSLSGLEFLAGIPGTVGGSLAGNAGAWGKSIGELAEEIPVLDHSGRQNLLKRNGLKFSYRRSNLGKYIILGCRFKLIKADKDLIGSRIKNYLSQRVKTQNTTLANAGCIFKNPKDQSAGRLIDLCKLKGKRKNGAMVSKTHANFILNLGNAKARDVMFLMDLARRKVHSAFGLVLAEEIKIWK